MNYFLIDQNNQIITVTQNIVKKSSVLSDFFKRYPTKAYNLDYPKKVIDQMIQGLHEMQGILRPHDQIFKNNKILYKLCQELNIMIDDLNDDGNVKAEQLNIEPYVMGQALHIFNSINFRGNEHLHKIYIESKEPAQYCYLITRPLRNKKKFLITMKQKLQSMFSDILYINDKHVITVSKTDFKNLYSVLNDNQCVKNDSIDEIINNKMTCNQRKYKQLIKMSWNYQIVESIPEMQIIMYQYNIGGLINGDTLGVRLNPEIFDIVVSLIIKQMKREINIFCSSTESHHLCSNKYNQIIEIQKDYDAYIVNIKKIYVNYNQ